MNIGLKMKFEKEKEKKRNQHRPPFQPRRPINPLRAGPPYPFPFSFSLWR
jgi:hypothetical protein